MACESLDLPEHVAGRAVLDRLSAGWGPGSVCGRDSPGCKFSYRGRAGSRGRMVFSGGGSLAGMGTAVVFADRRNDFMFCCLRLHSGLGRNKRRERKKETAPVHSLFAAAGPGSAHIKRAGPEGSYTVEAAMVMTVVLLSVWTMIRGAYRLHDQVTGGMILHEMIELSAHESQLDQDQIEAMGNRTLGHLFVLKSTGMILEQEGGMVSGRLFGSGQNLQIQTKRFRPQDFLREMTILEELREENGDSI